MTARTGLPLREIPASAGQVRQAPPAHSAQKGQAYDITT